MICKNQSCVRAEELEMPDLPDLEKWDQNGDRILSEKAGVLLGPEGPVVVEQADDDFAIAEARYDSELGPLKQALWYLQITTPRWFAQNGILRKITPEAVSHLRQPRNEHLEFDEIWDWNEDGIFSDGTPMVGPPSDAWKTIYDRHNAAASDAADVKNNNRLWFEALRIYFDHPKKSQFDILAEAAVLFRGNYTAASREKLIRIVQEETADLLMVFREAGVDISPEDFFRGRTDKDVIAPDLSIYFENELGDEYHRTVAGYYRGGPNNEIHVETGYFDLAEYEDTRLESRLRGVFRHELVHAATRFLVGEGAMTQAPWWFVEGIASYLGDGVEEDFVYKHDFTGARSPVCFESEENIFTAYNKSGWMVRYLEKQGGKGALERLLAGVAAGRDADRLWAEMAGGKNMEETCKNFSLYLEKEWKKVFDDVEGGLVGSGVKVAVGSMAAEMFFHYHPSLTARLPVPMGLALSLFVAPPEVAFPKLGVTARTPFLFEGSDGEGGVGGLMIHGGILYGPWLDASDGFGYHYGADLLLIGLQSRFGEFFSWTLGFTRHHFSANVLTHYSLGLVWDL